MHALLNDRRIASTLFLLALAACSTTNIYQVTGDGGSDPDVDPHDAWVDAPGEDAGTDTTLDAPADITFDTLESSDGDASSDGPVDAIEEPWICDPAADVPEGTQCAPEEANPIGCGPDASVGVPVVWYACEGLRDAATMPSNAGRCRTLTTFDGGYFDASFTEYGCETWSCQRYARFDTSCDGGGIAWACPYERLDAGVPPPVGCTKSSAVWATRLGVGGPLYCCP